MIFGRLTGSSRGPIQKACQCARRRGVAGPAAWRRFVYGKTADVLKEALRAGTAVPPSVANGRGQ